MSRLRMDTNDADVVAVAAASAIDAVADVVAGVSCDLTVDHSRGKMRSASRLTIQ